MLSDILSITDGAFHSLTSRDRVLDANQADSDAIDSLSSSSSGFTDKKDTPDVNKSSDIIPEKDQDKQNIAPFDSVKEDVFLMEETCIPSATEKTLPPARLKAMRILYQGNCKGNSKITEDDDVIAEKSPSQKERKLCRDKLEAKRDSKNQTLNPVVVHHVEKKNTDEEKTTHNCCNHSANSGEIVASSIAPFIQIQNALEDKISSLISTLQQAEHAEKEHLKREFSRKKLEDKDAFTDTLNQMAQDLKELKTRRCNEQTQMSEKTTAVKPVKTSSVEKAAEKPCSMPTLKNNSIKKPATEQQLFQTPIPRRKPPKPAYRHSTEIGYVSKEASAPRLSHKGYALLHEILKENQSPKPHDRTDNQKAIKPPVSQVHPITHSTDSQRINKSRDEIEEDKALHKEINRIMKEATVLKEDIKNVNKDMESVMVTSSDKSEESKEIVLRHYEPTRIEEEDQPVLVDHSISDECPLDKYLVYPKQTEFLKENQVEESVRKVDSVADRVADVLRKTEEKRRQLDDNIQDILRKHNELNVFLESPINEREENLRRIKKNVDAQIKIIHQDIQVELKQKESATKNSINSKPGQTKSNRVPLVEQSRNRISLAERNRIRVNSKSIKTKEDGQQKTRLKRSKPTKQDKITEPPPVSSTAYDELITRHLYGRHPQLPARKTIKRQATTANQTPKNTRMNYTGMVNEDIPVHTQKAHPSRDVFYFHPQQSTQQQSNLPVSGDLFPVALQLAEPSRDPSKRVPIYCNGDDIKKRQNERQPAKRRQLGTSNVAVVEVKHNESSTSEASSVKEQVKAKVRKRLKEKIKLNFQPLPNVDIDTTEASTLSATTSSISTSCVEQSKKSPSKNVDKNDTNGPYDFQEFVAVGDVQKVQNSTISEESESEVDFDIPATTLHGTCSIPPPSRPIVDDGPSFPPQHPRQDPVERRDFIQGGNNFEQVAHEWLEQEILAKIISKLEVQNPDPTLKEMADRAEVLPVQVETDSQSWLDNIIGYRGIQIFMDAGIPIDRDLIVELLRNVIVEKLDLLYGYSQPRGKDRDVTDLDEDYVEETFDPLQTPVRTPPPISARDASPPNLIPTPEQSHIESLMEQSLEKVNEEESSIEDEPVSYPLVTTPLPSEVSDCNNPDTDYPGNNMATPLQSIAEDTEDKGEAVLTPNLTEVEKEVSLVEQIDFIPTSPERALTPPPQPQFTPPITYAPRSPIQPKSPSTPSTTVQTYSTSTTVGLSTVDGVSEGEILCPSQIISDGSAGEPADIVYPYLIGQKTLEETLDDPFSMDLDDNNIGIKKLVKTIIYPSDNGQPLRSEGEVTAGGSSYSVGQVRNDQSHQQTDNDETQEDTLNSISLHQYDLVDDTRYKQMRPPVFVRPVTVAERAEIPYANVPDKTRDRISEGEFIIDDKSEKTNVSRDSGDLLSLGQLLPNPNYPITELSDNQSIRLSPLNSTADNPRIITVQKKQEHDVSQSEGEVPATLMRDIEINKSSTHMILTLPTVEDDNGLTSLKTLDADGNNNEEDLSEYDLSTLSGGEL